MQPFFSVIIPTFNRASLLPRAIDSVLKQTFADWEVIIVDDGSKDNTKEVVEKYADQRIRYIYQTNAERSVARNNGIDNAKGQYICFLDSDDYYLPNRLELLHHELINRGMPVGIFYTGLLVDMGRAEMLKSVVAEQGKNIFEKIALSVIHSQQVCGHRSVFENNKYDKQFHIGEDMELWLRIAEHYPFVYLDDQYTIVAVDHEDRSVNVRKYNSYAHQLRLFRYIFTPPHPGSKISPEIKAGLVANAYFGVAKYFIYNNRRIAAIMNMVQSIFADLRSNQLKFKVNILLRLLTYTSMQKVQELIKF